MVEGQYFDARSSAARPATLRRREDGQWVLDCAGQEIVFEPEAARISDRIGSIPRRIFLPGTGEFETRDNSGVDTLLANSSLQGNSGLVHGLERRWGIVLASLVGVVLACVGLVQYGLPTAARWAANVIPASADRVIGEQSLQILDAGFLDESRLDPQRQAQLATLFARMTAGIDDEHEYSLEVRDSRTLGANAFALPSGIVMVTDDLVQLAGNDEELMSVLAHEIGHVRGRHALRQMIQAAGLSVIAVVLLGDVSSVSALASSAPVLLQAKNSREFEREADTFARDWLQRQGIPPRRFDDMLCRLVKEAGGDAAGIDKYLASHPPVSERADCKQKEAK